MNKWAIRIILCCIVALIVPAFAFVYCYTWFLPPGGSSEIIDGMVGIRNYFYSGDGSKLSPFEITSPIHLYNLSRLQSLGIFSNNTYHFRIGTRVNYGTEEKPDYQYRCINGYDSSGNPVYSNHLDMSSFEDIIEPIGSEKTPFFGHFDGNNLPVRHLTITGNPEDIGFFGYVSYEGLVENLILDDVRIQSLGYSLDTGDKDNILYSAEIDPLFEAGGHYFKSADLKFVNNKVSPSATTFLRSKDVFELANINAGMTGELPNYIFNGFFELVSPTYTGEGKDPFTYSIHCATPLMQTYGEDEDKAKIDLQLLAENDDFNGTNDHLAATTRISIVASVEIDDIKFSRVIQSYTCKFQANPSGGSWTPGTNDWGAGNCKMSITCDYIDSIDGPYPFVNYHHGNNIGFIAGHVDGSMRNCYVYNGSFLLNDSGFNPIYTETQTGLIGEIGNDVENNIDPAEASGKGERGVMDITGIYNLIRSDFVVGDTVRAGRLGDNANAAKIISYSKKMKPTADLYKQYLRYDDYSSFGTQYITSASDISGQLGNKGYESAENYTIQSFDKIGINSVDFLWNKVIEEGTATIDGEEIERGLGVFKIVSSYQGTTSPYGTYMATHIGSSTIYNLFEKDRITDIFYTTAEIDWTKEGETNPWSDGVSPLKMTTLPSYSDLGTFRYPFSRDFNYVFRLDLSDESNQDVNRQYYMFNNNSAFLSNYLGNVLIDKDGMPVLKSTGTGVNEKFGFYLREKTDVALKYLQSYIVIKEPGEKKAFTLENGLTRYYPPNSIVFHIDNPNGANVSVIGNRTDISIYSFDSINSSGGVTQKYTMRSTNTGEENMHRYFNYNRSTGEVDRVANPISEMKDTDVAYAHIFKLTEPGDYVIGAARGSNNKSARIFYLAVQGQNEADLGDTTTYISGSGIEDVDFLLDPPLTEAQYSDSTTMVDLDNLNKAQLSFQAYFDNSAGTGTLTVSSFIDTLETVDTGDDRKCIRISFNDSTDFTSYLLANSKSLNPYFYLISGSESKKFVSASGKYPFAS